MQLPAIPQYAKGIGAQAVAARLDDGHHGRRTNGGVHRIAAPLQQRQAGLRGQWMRGGYDVAREDRQSNGRIARAPIETHESTRRQPPQHPPPPAASPRSTKVSSVSSTML